MTEAAGVGETLGACLRTATARLTRYGEAAGREAEILLTHVTGASRASLRAHPEHMLGRETRARFLALVERRANGEPMAYLLGEREFWSLRLKVSPATLIPRAETELLVEQALARIPRDAAWRIADLGTGSGNIALAVAQERPRCHVLAVDVAAPALEIAQENARNLHLANVEFRCGRWFEPLAGERFQLVVSNPPYIAAGDPHLRQGDLPHEPVTALVAGTDGLADLRHIAQTGRAHLSRGGWLLLEHGYDQGGAVRHVLHDQGYVEVTTLRDLGAQERVTIGRWGDRPL